MNTKLYNRTRKLFTFNLANKKLGIILLHLRVKKAISIHKENYLSKKNDTKIKSDHCCYQKYERAITIYGSNKEKSNKF